MLNITSDQDFEVEFKTKLHNKFPEQINVKKVALLATIEYEGIFKNGGIGTYYKTLSQKLALEGWYVILLLCHTENIYKGESNISVLKNIFSTYEINDILNLQEIHLAILAEAKENIVDYQSFCCLFYTQAIAAYFQQAQIYVEFHELSGIGYRTIQAKKANLLKNNCTTVVTMHSGHEWVYEANERYIEDYPTYFWHVSHCEQYSFENADLSFFPSHYLKFKVSQYGWETSHALHLPYFVPKIEFSDDQALKNSTFLSKNNLHSDRLTVVFFGRLEERKGLCVFIEAIKLLPRDLKSQIQIAFLGKVVPLQSSKLKPLDSKQYIAREIDRELAYVIFSNFNSEEAIQFVSKLNHPIVCLTSHQENFPNTALEMGQLPVSLVVSDTGGFRETLGLINRSSCVRWFTPRDPRSLCQVLEQAITAYPETPEISDKSFIDQINKSLLVKRLEYFENYLDQLNNQDFSKPKVTIGVTCYNLGEYLLECLNSLQGQTYSNLEIIVFDDGSTDKYTQNILKEAQLQFPAYKFIISDTNIGLGAARNYLINMASGEYFLCFDADNIALPFMVEKFVEAIDKSQATVVVCPQMQFGTFNRIRNFTGGSLPTVLQFNCCGDACSLFSTKFLKEFKHSEGREILNHDWQILASAVAIGEKIAYYPYPLYLYRVRTNSMISSADIICDRYYLRQYLSQIDSSRWSQRQIYMLLTAVQQLLQPSLNQSQFDIGQLVVTNTQQRIPLSAKSKYLLILKHRFFGVWEFFRLWAIKLKIIK
jgi:O-antigen biosynthesis protein